MKDDGASTKADLRSLASSLKRAYSAPVVTSVPLSPVLLQATPSPGGRCCNGAAEPCLTGCVLPICDPKCP